VNARRIIVAKDDVLAEGRSRNLALRGTDKWAESSELLHVITGREIHLDVFATELKLVNDIEVRRRRVKVR